MSERYEDLRTNDASGEIDEVWRYMKTINSIALILATTCVGLMAGVFFTYTVAVMPGLGETNDLTFVGAFQQIDHAIEDSVWVAPIYLGGLGFIIVATFLHYKLNIRSAIPWLIPALVLFAVTIAVTALGNVPSNDFIKAAGDPDRISDLAAVRAEFNESRWVRWNLVRTIASTAALGCLAWALVLHGRHRELNQEDKL